MAKKPDNLEDLFDDDLSEDREIFPTGIKVVDPELGGGIPEGVHVEAYGPPGSGKTSLGYSTIGQIQKLKLGRSVLFDVEGSWNSSMGKRLGIDETERNANGDKTFRRSDNAEMKVIENLFGSIKKILYGFDDVRFIMVDSVAALVPRSLTEMKKDDKTNTNAMNKARLLSVYMNELDRWIRDTGSKCTVYFVNHEKEEIGFSGHGPAKTTTGGGKALKYLASMRLEFRITKTDKIEVYDPVAKQTTKQVDKLYVRVQATKNRFYPPFRPATFIFDLGRGIDSVQTILAHAYAQGVITNVKGRISIPGEYTDTGEEVKIHGEHKTALYYEDHPVQFAKLEDFVLANMGASADVKIEPVEDSNIVNLETM